MFLKVWCGSSTQYTVTLSVFVIQIPPPIAVATQSLDSGGRNSYFERISL